MTAPRLEIRLDRIHHNARTLVDRLGRPGHRVTGVTKATLGSPEVARALLQRRRRRDRRVAHREHRGAAPGRGRRADDAHPLADAQPGRAGRRARRREPQHRARRARSPVGRRRAPGSTPRRRAHGRARRPARGHPARRPRGASSARRCGLPGPRAAGHRHQPGLPERRRARRATTWPSCRALADVARVDASASPSTSSPAATRPTSTGRSARDDVGRINDLRLGESILLGREPLHRRPIDGLRTDAFTLVAEVIESKVEADARRGARSARPPSAPQPPSRRPRRHRPGDRRPRPPGRRSRRPHARPTGMTILGASSDHLVLDAGPTPRGGTEVRFGLDYSALLRAMTSPFVTRVHDPRRRRLIVSTWARGRAPVRPRGRAPRSVRLGRWVRHRWRRAGRACGGLRPRWRWL